MGDIDSSKLASNRLALNQVFENKGQDNSPKKVNDGSDADKTQKAQGTKRTFGLDKDDQLAKAEAKLDNIAEPQTSETKRAFKEAFASILGSKKPSDSGTEDSAPKNEVAQSPVKAEIRQNSGADGPITIKSYDTSSAQAIQSKQEARKNDNYGAAKTENNIGQNLNITAV